MPNIADMDFSQNDPEINVALVKLQAMHNLGKLPEDIYDGFIPQLKGTEKQKKIAIEKIEDLEDGWFNPFVEEYWTEVLRLIETKSRQDFSNNFFSFTSINLRNFKRKISVRDKSFASKPEDFASFQVRDNKDFTIQKAKEIVRKANSLPKCIFNGNTQLANTCVVISTTKGLNKEALRLLAGNPNIAVSYLGKHVMQRPGVDEYLSPENLLQCMEKMESIEKGINPKWSDTAKALYIFNNLYKSCQYDNNSSNCMKSVFVDNKSICQGFAIAYQEMMMRQNIPCHICTSETAGHVFNEIKLNNTWYPVDVSDAAYIRTNYDYWKEEQISRHEFAGERFISLEPDDHKDHHRDYYSRFMVDKEKDIINYLTKEEYESAVAEIENRQGTNEKELLNDEAQQEKYKRAKGQKESINQDNSSLDAILCKRFEDLHKR